MPPKKQQGKTDVKQARQERQRVNRLEDRNMKQNLRKQRNAKKYGDAEWKQDFNALSEQLRPFGLTIKDVAGDGNCLFRAIADQIEGDPNRHVSYRKRILDFIEENRAEFEFFIEDDEPFERYISRMRTNAEWGGQTEIQAASLVFAVNITLYQLGLPRWEICNFPASSVRMIHISYHNGEHYCSVRNMEDPNKRNGGPPLEIKLVDSSKPKVKEEKIKEKYFFQPTEEEITIMSLTNCYNQLFIHKLWVDNNYDTEAVCEFIFMANPDEEFMEEYLNEKSSYEKFSDDSPYEMGYNSTKSNNNNNNNNNKNKNHNNKEDKRPPNIVNNQPKLSNKERKEMQRKEKEEEFTKTNNNKNQNKAKASNVNIDVSGLPNDLGSMRL